MTTIAAAPDGAMNLADAAHAPDVIALQVAGSIAVAEPAWRELERDVCASPYARYDWAAAFAEAETAPVRVVVGRDRSGRPALILPLVLRRKAGLVVAEGLGGKHANCGGPLVRADVAASMTPVQGRDLLGRAGRAVGADLVQLVNVPADLAGARNPFGHGPAGDGTWALRLDPDGERTLARSMSAAARKKLRNKARALAKLGVVDIVEAASEPEVDRLLAAFLGQKEKRFAEQGIADPFADRRLRAAIRRAALPGPNAGPPAIELYGLALGDRIVAVLGGAGDARRLSGMFVSFDAGEVAKHSPGEILVTEVVRRQCARGRSVFDLGVGEARYKASICDEVEPLVSAVVPVSIAGRVASAALLAGLSLKRRLKSDPAAMRWIGRARRIAARVRRA